MINIDQDLLCDFCKSYNDSNMDGCEGTQCEKMAELYLDDLGITEENPDSKSFGKLKVGDPIYIIDYESIIPSMRKQKINSLSQMNTDKLRIHYESQGVLIEDEEGNSQGKYFLNMKDCEKKLEEICTGRIIELSKVIGSIK